MKAELKEEHDMIGNLREENRDTKIIIFGNMDICEDVIFKAKIMKRKTMPLHKQGRNLFGKKKSLQEEIRELQEDNKTLYEDSHILSKETNPNYVL